MARTTRPPRSRRSSPPRSRRRALALARATLATHLTHEGQLADWFGDHKVEGNLAAPSGVFVTINNRGAKAKKAGRLRGCIGTMEATEPLVDAIVDAAVSAAHDPRFPELDASELPEVELEVSVLSPMRPVPGPDAIVLGKHGVLLTKSGRRAVFLPQVATETGWDLNDVPLEPLAQGRPLRRRLEERGDVRGVHRAGVRGGGVIPSNHTGTRREA